MPAEKKPDAYHHGGLRAELIRCAVETIDESGVEGLSLRALAKQIGVSHAAPTRHFDSRGALLAAIAREGIMSLTQAAARQTEDSRLTNREKLKAMSTGYVTWAATNPVHHLLIRNQDVTRHADEELLADIDAYARLHEKTIALAQQDGWRRGEPTRAVFLEITAFTAGLALVSSDPIYKTVLGKPVTGRQINAAISAFFAD